MKVGGRAEWLLEPADPEELRRAYLRALELGHAPRVLGGGANLIVADGVLPGVVIATDRLRRLFRPSPDAPAGASEALDVGAGLSVSIADARAFWSERAHADPRLVAWCGVSMPGIARAAQELGWSGFEGLVGVPGHVGGGVAMNAGGRWGSVWDAVELVRVLEPDGGVRDLARADCAPRYRDGDLAGRIVLGCVLRLRPESVAAVRERTREFLLEKNKSQPVTEHSSGCIFKNPDPELADGRSAGRLIEDAGAKGLARGDAVVSAKHANFIVNRGRASAADVLGLIEDVRARVETRTGIRLEREVRVWDAG
jgi:UDP-N-acetylmuramate dehydrogenase